MKIEQTEMIFNPIMVSLETKDEATAFLQMVERFTAYSLITDDQKGLCIKISNAFSNMEVQI